MATFKALGFLKRHKILIFLLLVASVVVFLVSSYGFIEVDSGASSGEMTYKLQRQGSQNADELKSTSTKIRKLVRKGSYEILVKSGDKSSFAVAQVKGFLSTTTVSSRLAPEKGRTFVGDNPGPCMYYADLLYSYSCGGTLADIVSHLPATDTQPSYTMDNSVNVEDLIEGFIKTKDGDFVIVQSFSVEGGNSPHTAYKVKNGVDAGGGIELAGLDSAKSYSIDTFRQGFIAYDDSFSSLVYYESVSTQPKAIVLESPEEAEFKPYLFDASGERILALYSNNTAGEVADIHDPGDNVKNEIVVYDNGSQKKFSLDGRQYSGAKLCGNNEICLLSEKDLIVYGISGNKLQQLFQVSSVNDVEMVAGTLLVFRDKEVLSLSIDPRNGSINYSLGDYKFCGVRVGTSSYVLCLINSKDEKLALRVDMKVDSSDNIDKKIAQLLKLPEVASIPIYDKRIFISPELGELVFNQSSGGFGYDPAKRQAVASKINQELNELRIDRNVYSVTNTLE
jgi:hypothetical protein